MLGFPKLYILEESDPSLWLLTYVNLKLRSMMYGARHASLSNSIQEALPIHIVVSTVDTKMFKYSVLTLHFVLLFESDWGLYRTMPSAETKTKRLLRILV